MSRATPNPTMPSATQTVELAVCLHCVSPIVKSEGMEWTHALTQEIECMGPMDPADSERLAFPAADD